MTESLTADPTQTAVTEEQAAVDAAEGGENRGQESFRSALPDLTDLLARPQHRRYRSPARPKGRSLPRRRVKAYKSNSLLSPTALPKPADARPSQSNSSFYPQFLEPSKEKPAVTKTVRLREMRDIYSAHLMLPRTPLTPPHVSRRSIGSPRVKKPRETPSPLKPASSLLPRDSDYSSSFATDFTTPFPFLQRPKRDLTPIRTKHSSKSPKSQRVRETHERSATSIEGNDSPYHIKFAKPYLRKNFKLFVDVELRSSSGQPGLVIKKANKRREAGSQDRRVFKMLNSLL